MKLVDTSSWIHALRKSGNQDTRARVFRLLEDGDAAWCHVVRLELWQGAVHPKEIAYLKDLEKDIPCLPMTETAWDHACKTAFKLRKAGETLRLTDVMIHACAHAHGIEVEHMDKHFDTLKRLDS